MFCVTLFWIVDIFEWRIITKPFIFFLLMILTSFFNSKPPWAETNWIKKNHPVLTVNKLLIWIKEIINIELSRNIQHTLFRLFFTRWSFMDERKTFLSSLKHFRIFSMIFAYSQERFVAYWQIFIAILNFIYSRICYFLVELLDSSTLFYKDMLHFGWIFQRVFSQRWSISTRRLNLSQKWIW